MNIPLSIEFPIYEGLSVENEYVKYEQEEVRG